jgi:hypothetical protein
VDQWFTESQFESYRELGYHEVMTSMLGEAATTLPTGAATPTNGALDARLKIELEKFGFDVSRLATDGQKAS